MAADGGRWCWASVALLAAFACAEEDTQVRPAFTRAQLLDPKNCADCHPKHYAEWSASMHAYASKDPVFLAMNRRGQEKSGEPLAAFCVNCHAPMAVHDGAISDYSQIEALPEHLQGVTCYFCHNAIGVGDEHFNGQIKLANDNI